MQSADRPCGETQRPKSARFSGRRSAPPTPPEFLSRPRNLLPQSSRGGASARCGPGEVRFQRAICNRLRRRLETYLHRTWHLCRASNCRGPHSPSPALRLPEPGSGQTLLCRSRKVKQDGPLPVSMRYAKSGRQTHRRVHACRLGRATMAGRGRQLPGRQSTLAPPRPRDVAEPNHRGAEQVLAVDRLSMRLSPAAASASR